MYSLTHICIGTNNLKELPLKLLNLQNLRELHLDNNELSTIPEDICELSNLEDFRIHGNKLEELPNRIIQLEQLKFISIIYMQKLLLTDEQKKWIRKLEANGCEVFYDKDLLERDNYITSETDDEIPF